MEERIVKFRELLGIAKTCYEEYYDAIDDRKLKQDLLDDLLRIRSKYEDEYKILNTLRTALIIFCAITFISLILRISGTSILLFSLSSFITIVIFVFFLISRRKLSNISEKIQIFFDSVDDGTRRFVSTMSFGDILNNIDRIIPVFEQALQKAKDFGEEKKNILISNLANLDPYVTGEYQGYSNCCAMILIIDNKRADNMKDIVNTMVEDVYHENLIYSISHAARSINGAVADMTSKMASKLESMNSQLKKQTTIMAANTTNNITRRS